MLYIKVIGVGAGQQSRIHCTRLAGDKADFWWLRMHPKALNLPLKKGLKRADAANAVEAFVGGHPEDYADSFELLPPPLSEEEKRKWGEQLTGVALSSDAFFPFRDSLDRARKVRL